MLRNKLSGLPKPDRPRGTPADIGARHCHTDDSPVRINDDVGSATLRVNRRIDSKPLPMSSFFQFPTFGQSSVKRLKVFHAQSPGQLFPAHPSFPIAVNDLHGKLIPPAFKRDNCRVLFHIFLLIRFALRQIPESSGGPLPHPTFCQCTESGISRQSF